MTEEIQYLDDELRDLIVEIQKGIDELSSPAAKKLAADKRNDKFNHLQNRLARAKQLYHAFKVELRELQRDALKDFQAVGNFALFIFC